MFSVHICENIQNIECIEFYRSDVSSLLPLLPHCATPDNHYIFYRPQTKLREGNVLQVCDSVHRGGGGAWSGGGCLVPGVWWRPPGRLLLRAVCILLECILVIHNFMKYLPSANEVAERLCFYTCLSFCPQGAGFPLDLENLEKWEYTWKTWKYHGILKNLINIMEKWHETWKNFLATKNSPLTPLKQYKIH